MPIFDENEQCFCGSGEKYKNCHYRKVFDHHNQLGVEIIKCFRRTGTCIALEDGVFCGKKTVASHSIQKGQGLSRIAKNGHVFAFPDGPHGKSVAKNGGGFEQICVNQASTFAGFCSKHDSELFRYIETQKISNGFRAAFLTAYRSHCYETVSHSNGALISQYFLEDTTFKFDFDKEAIRETVENVMHYASYCWYLKHLFEKNFRKETSKRFYFFSVLFNQNLPFASSGSFAIEKDFDARTAQKMSETGAKFNYTQLWVLPLKNGQTFAGIGGINDQNPQALKQFIKSLSSKPESKLADFFLRAAITHSENTFFSPTFIESLSENAKAMLLKYFSDTKLDDVGQNRDDNCLTNPLPFSLLCDVISRKTNIKR